MFSQLVQQCHLLSLLFEVIRQLLCLTTKMGSGVHICLTPHAMKIDTNNSATSPSVMFPHPFISNDPINSRALGRELSRICRISIGSFTYLQFAAALYTTYKGADLVVFNLSPCGLCPASLYSVYRVHYYLRFQAVVVHLGMAQLYRMHLYGVYLSSDIL